ncbi:Flp pilus assembly protein TadD [Maritalea mobilis]|uniref:Flp pilus assembly protein TadD n=2 Tax=Maritalea mobilis TaxID=483324 RepID=A0A4R6VLA4_9HYPH|nr:Flp pilus assembly protein TadD [Maritalea mobilis]
MVDRQKSIMQKLRVLALAGVAAIALNACASPRGAGGGGTATPDFSGMSNAAKHAAVQDLGAKYQKSPNKQSAIYFAAALRAVGQTGQAVSVLEKARLQYKNDFDVALAYAKALAADGRFDRALNVLDVTIRPERPNWNALSVKGAIFDQMGRNAEARTLYNQALVIAPNEPSLYANLGLSFAMSNQLDQAEAALRRAISFPKASRKVRLNLALVIGLQGRFDGARSIYARELPPEDVEANMAYIRALLTQQNKWDRIKGSSN